MKIKKFLGALICGALLAGTVYAAPLRPIGSYNYNYKQKLEIPKSVPVYDVGNHYNKGGDKNDFWAVDPPWTASIPAYLTYDETEQAIKMDHKNPSTAGNGLEVNQRDMRLRFKAKAFNIDDKFKDPGDFSAAKQDIGFFFAIKLRTMDITSGPWDGMPGWSIDYHPYIHEDGDRYKKWHNAYATAVNVQGNGFNSGKLPWFTDDSRKINWMDGKYHDVDVAIWDDADGYANIVMELDGIRVINYKDDVKNRYSDPGSFSIMPVGCSLYIKPADPLPSDGQGTTTTTTTTGRKTDPTKAPTKTNKTDSKTEGTAPGGEGNVTTPEGETTLSTGDTTESGLTSDTTGNSLTSSTVGSGTAESTTTTGAELVNGDKKDGPNVLAIVLSIVGAVLVLGGGACAYIFYFRKKWAKN